MEYEQAEEPKLSPRLTNTVCLYGRTTHEAASCPNMVPPWQCQSNSTQLSACPSPLGRLLPPSPPPPPPQGLPAFVAHNRHRSEHAATSQLGRGSQTTHVRRSTACTCEVHVSYVTHVHSHSLAAVLKLWIPPAGYKFEAST
jgi:hypothetical protein